MAVSCDPSAWGPEPGAFGGGRGEVGRADALRSELESCGLVLLAVSAHRTDPDRFTVYLHGAAAQWVNGEAIQTVTSVPGVIDVVESIQSSSILLVRYASSGEPFD